MIRFFACFTVFSFAFSSGGGTDSHDVCVLTHRGSYLLEDTV
ncbi:hypothetical protein STRDD11_01295 [Streptococcus sp. DD11]|nr:hypothetical protein STRDD11_01295 [Streptococcus sp. DD11]